ncbi:helix-turn-helix domain-containing protein [Ensifer sp. SL37]|uniref:helix-turn-helix domain-containing protein n=1 Tax=Ensifer sp. SL37 TaxID=2995137 RepID=UPI0022764092|nr:helix-turn-helix transcriptional regulator [Ensifer sp. SL37]MCY1744560.1 helix-turn-helix transcriptional regulator [Ensifer sp. SL37]
MNMTRRELAKQMKIAVMDIEKIERGFISPSETYVAKVTGVLGLSMTEVKNALKDQAEPRQSSDNVVLLRGR